jgi:hypothetical protein
VANRGDLAVASELFAPDFEVRDALVLADHALRYEAMRPRD